MVQYKLGSSVTLGLGSAAQEVFRVSIDDHYHFLFAKTSNNLIQNENVSIIRFWASWLCVFAMPTAEAAYGFLLTTDNCIGSLIKA